MFWRQREDILLTIRIEYVIILIIKILNVAMSMKGTSCITNLQRKEIFYD